MSTAHDAGPAGPGDTGHGGRGHGGGGHGGGGGTPPGGSQALVAEIERTREELGQTVQALAAKADVKARAQERAAEVTSRVRARLTGTRQELPGVTQDLTARAGRVAGGLAGKAVSGCHAAGERGKTLLGRGEPAARQITGRAAQAGTAAWNAAPEPVQRGARRAGRAVGRHRVPAVAVAGAVLLAGWLAVRWRRRT